MSAHTELSGLTSVLDLAPGDLREAIEETADLALNQGRVAVLLGATDTQFVVCTGWCCLDETDVFVVVPDVKVVEYAANGTSRRGPHFRVMRVADQRVCVVYRVGRAVAP